MDYGNILRRAGEITWRHKLLWLFGFLASLNTRFRFDVDSEIPPVRHLRHWAAEFVSSPSFGPVVVSLFLFFLLVSLVFSILKALGRSGLVDQVNQIENGFTPTVQAGWQAAKRYGWRVFWISFLLGLPTLVLMMVGLLPLIIPLILLVLGLTGAGPGGLSVFEPWSQFLICFTPACCLGVLLGEFLGVIGALAERVCILEDRSVWESITGGWELLRDKFAPVAVLWLILVGVRVGIVVLFILMLLPLAVISLPFVALS